jgi:hypothetical protein
MYGLLTFHFLLLVDIYFKNPLNISTLSLINIVSIYVFGILSYFLYDTELSKLF